MKKNIQSDIPSQVNSQTVLDYYIQLERISTCDNLQPEDNLAALNNWEKWYKDKNLDVPFPEWLTETRDFWERKG